MYWALCVASFFPFQRSKLSKLSNSRVLIPISLERDKKTVNSKYSDCIFMYFGADGRYSTELVIESSTKSDSGEYICQTYTGDNDAAIVEVVTHTRRRGTWKFLNNSRHCFPD